MKLIGIVIAVMLIMTIFAVAQPYEKQGFTRSIEKTSSASLGVDVPVWEVGDAWTYKVENISIDYVDESQSLDMYLGIEELPLVVIDATGDYYTLTFTTSTSGHGMVNTDRGSGPVNISLLFDSVAISGKVVIEKSTLGVKEISASLEAQKFTFDVLNQPYITLPTWLQHISTKITMNISTNYDTPATMLSFPMNTGSAWNLNALSFTIDGKIQCIWFNILNFVNNIAKLIGMEFMPPEIAELLPVIDIDDTLSTLGPGNVFEIPPIAYAFYCPQTDNITVAAGSYEAYNINIIGGAAECYYAPSAGNIIKITGNFEDILPAVKTISLELVSTNYS